MSCLLSRVIAHATYTVLLQLAAVQGLSKFTFNGTRAMDDSSWPMRDIFVFAGQSNCVGAAQLEDLPDRLASNHGDVPHVFAWPKANGKQWSPYSIQETNGFNLKGAFGPELAFSHELAASYRQKHESFGITKVAKIGTSLHKDWSLSGWSEAMKNETKLKRMRYLMYSPDEATNEPYLFSMLVDTARSARNSPQCDGGRCNIKALIWVQGEADATLQKEDAEQYGKLLDDFMSTLRGALNSPDLFIIIAQLHPDLAGKYQNPGAESVLSAQSKFVEKEGMQHAALVPTGEIAKLPDGLHYDAEGEYMLGKMAAKAYLDANLS